PQDRPVDPLRQRCQDRRRRLKPAFPTSAALQPDNRTIGRLRDGRRGPGGLAAIHCARPPMPQGHRRHRSERGMIGGRLQQAIAGMMPRKTWAAHLLAGLSIVYAGGAAAQTPASLSEAEICLAANRAPALGAPLPRTAARLNAGEAVKIVAIGSSSTTGLWVLSPSATYPEVMRRELARLRPAARIEIINSGRVGETIGGSIARFERDVLAHAPDLVVGQLGTNDVAWGGRADGLKDRVI